MSSVKQKHQHELQHRKSSPRIRLELDILEDRLTPSAIYAVGAGPNHSPRVQVYDAASHEKLFDFTAFSSSFRGGVNVAVGDIDGDNIPDIVVSTGPGGAPRVKVYDGSTGEQFAGPLGNFLAFSPSFKGGVQVATGDVNRDGLADVIVGAGAGGAPRVKVFSGADGSVLANFLAFGADFTGGVRVASGDFRHRLGAEIVVAAGGGGSPRVKVFAGDNNALLANYLAFPESFRGGVYLGTGDINHDGTIDVIAGSGAGGKGAFKVFSGMSSTVITQQAAAGPSYTGAVKVDAVDGNNDGFEDILASLSSSNGPILKIYDGDNQLVSESSAFTANFISGSSVAGSVPRGRGNNYQLAEAVTKEIPVLERLAQYVPIDTAHPAGQYLPVGGASINGAQNVYVLTHGWAPGYREWVNKYIDTHVLKWWETAGYNNTLYPSPNPALGPSTAWMFEEYAQDNIPISPKGALPEELTKADPNALVLAYSWIDDSATTSALSNSIPQQAYLSEALTNVNGLRLAEAIRQALGANFSGKIHLIGHSHGTKVATLAAVSLNQSGAHHATQLTIFDSPESAETDEINASNFLWHYFQQLPVSKHPNQGVFIDNYFSAFGVNYATMQINSQTPLNQIIDTQLFAYPYSRFYQTDPTDWHSYPPAWYAQAHYLPSNSGTNGGLAWSPLLGHDPSTLVAEWEQAWSYSGRSAATQAQLTNPFFTVTPGVTFDSLTIQNADSTPPQPVTSIQLGLGAGQEQTFSGTYSKNSGWSGISFEYAFTGATQGILKIQINDYLAYYVDSRYIPTGVTQKVTMNIGWPTLSQTINVILLPPPGEQSSAQVTLTNFKQFDVSLL